MQSVLIISNSTEILPIFRQAFPPECALGQVSTIDQALHSLQNQRRDLLFIDMVILQLAAQFNGYTAAMQPFLLQYPTLKIVVMATENLLPEAISAVDCGASHYVTHPIIPDEVRLLAETITEQNILASELDYLRDKCWQEDSFDLLNTDCLAMQKVFENVRAVAPTRSTVLLNGETGTGKGVIAKLIHRYSNRRNAQFISIHCGAIPDSLLESELFGHEKGAFTGAVKRKLGKFEIASGGTIFLDEIGTITPAAQIKLLHVLQNGTIQRVGGEEFIQPDVRIIAATNIDLKKLCVEKKFREDLYYRLNVFPLTLPPLRERLSDIQKLYAIFLKRLNKFDKKEIHDVHPHVTAAFLNYSWPGNIRELENIIERAYILETSSIITPDSIPAELFKENAPVPRGAVNTSSTLSEVRKKAMEEVEEAYLRELLTRNLGKINRSAATAGITTRQLHKLMIKYALRKESFKVKPPKTTNT
jgi:DNA-binding NtrC family response regulator